MKTFFYNIGYFILEAARTIRFSPLSNFFSVIGTGLILFLLGIVCVGWSVGDRIVQMLEQEAEISAYITDTADPAQIEELEQRILRINGVTEVTFISEEQAKSQMEKLLGEEARILELFDENPFERFLEVRIRLDRMDEVIAGLELLPGIDYVRDNREVLEQMRGITEGMKLGGAFLILAVGITTLIIISHMIRQGIYNNREQIKTLRLLGAPGGFIGFPFLLAGTLMTLLGGILAALVLYLMLQEGYRQLGEALLFLPLPGKETLQREVSMILLTVSAVLGLLGSLFGLGSMRTRAT
ncbi:cell division transport system permease protein [Anaerotaenia torta]|uniref:cell division protein FtsX n=1 Tax=Anaerotaenia torta TaxID=433293 RepID=UPI003D1BA668